MFSETSLLDQLIFLFLLRSLWPQRINAGARLHGISYSVFINGLKKLNIELDRKILADLAMNEPTSFEHLAKQVQSSAK